MSEGILINKTGGSSFTSYALVEVLAPTGTDVTLTSSRNVSKTITADKSKVLASNANYSAYFFNVGTSEFGSCTITGVDGNFTMTKLVSVTNNVKYTFEISHRCPSAYQEVEYIRISQRAYIEVGKCFTSKSTYKYDCIVLLEALAALENWSLMAPHGSNRAKFSITTSGQIYLQDYNSGNSLTGQIVANTWHHIIINEDNNLKIAVDGVVSPTNYAAGYFANSDATYLINCRYRQTDGQYTSFNAKWKQFIVTDQDSNTVVCNLIPCYRISDGVAGFYDVTSDIFLSNAGAGSITAGPAV